MNREILFKAKRLDTGKWITGGCFQLNNCTCIVVNAMEWHEVDPETVCQYTGLMDTNGRKIYEGDILMCHDNKNDLVKAVFGEFCVIDVETISRIDKVIGWHYEVLPTDACSMFEPYNLSMPLTDMYIKRCEMVVSTGGTEE